MSDWPIWDLDDANAMIPQLVALTQDAIDQIARAERAWHGLPFRTYDAIRGATHEDLIRADWARAVASLGIQPQAYFVVAMQSIDAQTLLCWSYGDTHITREFSCWETFEHCRRISDTNRFRYPQAPEDSHPEDDPLRDEWLRDET